MVLCGFSFLGISKSWDLIKTIDHYKVMIIMFYIIMMFWWEITAWLLHRYTLERLATNQGVFKRGIEKLISKNMKDAEPVTTFVTEKPLEKNIVETKKVEDKEEKTGQIINIDKLYMNKEEDKDDVKAYFEAVDKIARIPDASDYEKEIKKIEKENMLNEIKKHIGHGG